MKIKLLLIAFILSSSYTFSQEKEDLFSMIEQDQKQIELLPEKMIFTQSLLWGKNGLLRKTGISPLNLENREKELKIRKTMLTTHQAIGYLTLAYHHRLLYLL